MPYNVVKDDRCPASKPWGVVTVGTNDLHGCHATKHEAQQQQSALYTNVPDAAAAGAEPVGVPPLVTLPGVELVAAGTWDLSTGEATFTREDLASAVDACQCPAVGDPIIKLGHVDPRFDGQPAVGRVRNMGLATDGNKITGDLAGLPGWFGAVSGSAYPKRSIEGAWDFRCQIGHIHPFVITAVALLGATPPGVGTIASLADVAALYGVAASTAEGDGRAWQLDVEGAAMTQVPVLAAGATVEDVRRAFYDSAPMTQWITELQLNPPQLIVCDDATAKVFRVPVKLSGGAISFGAPVEVQIEYVDAPAAAAASGQVRWASAAASREVVAAWNAAQQVKNMGDNPPKSAINAMFALPADTKSDSKLPHHDAADGKVGAANPDGCTAAIAAINGGRGGLSGVSAADHKRAYDHLAAHLRAAGQEPPDYTGPAASAPAEPTEPVEAAPGHAVMTGTHDHAHSAYGSQGGDATHSHAHTHAGDNTHSHAHGAATERGSKVELNDEQMAALRASLGLADDDDLTPDVLVTKLGHMAEAAAAKKAAAGGVKLPDGVTAIDKDALEDLRRRAGAGEEALRRIRNGEREDVLAAAVKQGKFPVSKLDKYRRAWDLDPENTRSILASMAKNQVPTDDIGTAGGEDDLLEDEYRKLFPPVREGTGR